MSGRGMALFVEWNCFPGLQLVSLLSSQGEQRPRASICKSLCCHKRRPVILSPRWLSSKNLFLHLKLVGVWGGPEGGLWTLKEVSQGEGSGGSVFVMSECCRNRGVHVPLKSELAPLLLSVVM